MKAFDPSILVPAHVRSFSAYYPSKPDSVLMRLYGVSRLHRLNNNENALGPPPEAAALVEDFPPESVPIYPNGDCHDLRCILAGKFRRTENQFLVGNGSCEVISSVIKAFCTQGDNIITADKTFAVYEWVAQFSGIEARLIPLQDYAFDPQAMLDAMDGRTKILFVCNPNNPTGTYWDRATMTGFLDQVDNRALVVIDEAYFEYVEEADYPDGMALMDTYPNVVVFRTFSKMYALAALRIGYLCASEPVVELIRRTHIVYSVNTLAQQAAAAALSNDEPFIAATRHMVNTARQRLCALFENLSLEYVANQGNYVMVRLPISDTLMYRKLMPHGIMVRTMTGFRFPNWIRVSLVQADVMERFCEIFSRVIEEEHMTKKAIPVEPDQTWTVHMFRPQDAPGVTDLFRSIYGDKYPVRTYLEPELLARENREGRVISSVATIPSGAVVGHHSLFNSAPNPRIFESGAGVVHRLYRGGRGITTRLSGHGIEMGKNNPGIDLIYGETVCKHPFSQKAMDKARMICRAMEVSLMPAAAYVKEQSAEGRVSTVLGFLTLKPRPCTVFVPRGLEDHFSLCYEGLDDTRTFEAAGGGGVSPESRIHTQIFEFAQVARVAVHDAGKNFQGKITAESERLISQGIRVIQVWLNTGQSCVGQAVDHLKTMGYFFGGVLPQWFGTDGMLMQKVLDEPDWERAVLANERNAQIAGLVRREWEVIQTFVKNTVTLQ